MAPTLGKGSADAVLHDETLESRSFWKAGACDIRSNPKTFSSEGELEHARVHPKFLHSNATSHKWAFGAIAELLDNAVDEIQNGATFVKVDKIDLNKDNSPALTFQDDGGGMDPDSIRKCMSLGYSSKKSNTTIGQYGNGFKTSTMRLGADAIVFSCATRGSKATQSIGLLSYTFLRKTGQDDVIVPMVDFDVSGDRAEPIIYGTRDDWISNLKIIIEWGPFASRDELMKQFQDIGSHGTKIIIYNLWLNDEGIYELSLDDDAEDIRLRDESNNEVTKLRRNVAELQSHISYRLRYSLRAYASILYLRAFKNFKIILRGKPVEQFNIADELKYPKVVTYKPQSAMRSEAVVDATIGFLKEAPSLAVTGYNVYHKNRLIRPFWKVTADGSSKGHGVVGVLEANFIEPAHDKQDFERSSLFVRLESKLKQILMDYWYGHCHLYGYSTPTNKQKEMPGIQQDTGSSMFQRVQLDQSIVGLPASVPQVLRQEHRENHSDVGQPLELPSSISQTSPDPVTCEDEHIEMSAEELCEENLNLYIRCEEYAKKETELKVTVGELEKTLAETKDKCAKLKAQLEIRRKEIAGLTTI